MACNRRRFLRNGLALLSAVPVASALQRTGVGSVLTPSLAHAQVKTALSLEHPQAKALGYVHDASKVDTAKFPKRAGAEGAKQLCSNCQLLVQTDMKVEGEDGTWGKCALFTDGLVNVNGWCNSWVLKAGM
ncbi:high-potential iron-sulfur protein [bacterium]|nr:high-potential iron-sulfur protein [bacterium]